MVLYRSPSRKEARIRKHEHIRGSRSHIVHSSIQIAERVVATVGEPVHEIALSDSSVGAAALVQS